MSFQVRLTLALVAIAALPLVLLGYGVQREMTARLDADAAQRVDAARSAVAARLAELQADQQRRLESLAAELAGDNRFRSALSDPESADRQWLLDWASVTRALTGFSVLQIQDSLGRILSSGQFRNDYDRLQPHLPRAVTSSAMRTVILDARIPDGAVRALVSAASFSVRGAPYTIIGGVGFDSVRVASLSPDRLVASRLVIRTAVPSDSSASALTLPYVNDMPSNTAEPLVGGATLELIPDNGPTRALRAGITRWVLLTLGGTLLVAVVMGGVLGRVIAAPIVSLSSRTARLDLDRLNVRFASGRDDELGALERTLDALTSRLRSSVARLRDAERAAVTGDLARQVNHDIKNGLAPIRNVLRHLAQTAEREPAQLPVIFAERRGTLESSVEYLDALARNYARLSPNLTRGPTDPRPVVLALAEGITSTRVLVQMPDALPSVRADGVVLHRILDNLVSNAVDAVGSQAGTVSIAVESIGTPTDRRVRFSITDTGCGMTREALDLAFNDFHTTKTSGTGLGLSVVRRLLTDVGGSMRVETVPGEGSTFTVDIPAVAS